MAKRISPRLPLRPLLDRLGDVPYGMFAEMAGVTFRRVVEWASTGIPEPSADRVAVKLGFHPAEVWGMAWWSIPFYDEEAVAEAKRIRKVAQQRARRQEIRV